MSRHQPHVTTPAPPSDQTEGVWNKIEIEWVVCWLSTYSPLFQHCWRALIEAQSPSYHPYQEFNGDKNTTLPENLIKLSGCLKTSGPCQYQQVDTMLIILGAQWPIWLLLSHLLSPSLHLPRIWPISIPPQAKCNSHSLYSLLSQALYLLPLLDVIALFTLRHSILLQTQISRDNTLLCISWHWLQIVCISWH